MTRVSIEKKDQALTIIGETVISCLKQNKKPTRDQMLNMLHWAQTGLGIDPFDDITRALSSKPKS